MEGTGTTNITLSQYNVFKKVQTGTYYLGEARKDDISQLDAGSRVQVSTDEEDLLRDYFSSAINRINKLLTRYLGECTHASTNDGSHSGYTLVTFTVKSPVNFMTSQVSELEDVIEDDAVNVILQQWLAVMKPGEEQLALQKIMELETAIRVIVNNRTKPSRS